MGLGRSQQHGGGLAGGGFDLVRALEQGHRQPGRFQAQAGRQLHDPAGVRVGDEQHVDPVGDFVAVGVRQEPFGRIDVGQVHLGLCAGARTARNRPRRRVRSQGRKHHLPVCARHDHGRHAREPQRQGVGLVGRTSGRVSGRRQALQSLEGIVGVGRDGELQLGAQPQVAVHVHHGPAEDWAARCGLHLRASLRPRARSGVRACPSLRARSGVRARSGLRASPGIHLGIPGRLGVDLRIGLQPTSQLVADLFERRSRRVAHPRQCARQRPRRPKEAVVAPAGHGQPADATRCQRCHCACAGCGFGRPERRPRQPRFRQGAAADRDPDAKPASARSGPALRAVLSSQAGPPRQRQIQCHGLEAQAGRDLGRRHAFCAGRLRSHHEGGAQAVGHSVLVFIQQKVAVAVAGRVDEQRRQVEVRDLVALTGDWPSRPEPRQQD